MYDAELGSHPATSDSPQRRGNEQLRYAVDSTIEKVETQVVDSVLVEVQKEVGEFWEEVCRRGVWFFDLGRGRTITVPCGNKLCAICRRKMATWYVRQIEHEGVERYEVVLKGRWGAYQKMLTRKGFAYKRLPVQDGVVAVSNMGTLELPTDVTEFLDGIIIRTKGMGRINGSHKFGGPFAGYREKRGQTGQYWHPRGGWSLERVLVDVNIALGSENWKLVPYDDGDGFRLIGLWRQNSHVFELAGIVGAGGQVVW